MLVRRNPAALIVLFLAACQAACQGTATRDEAGSPPSRLEQRLHQIFGAHEFDARTLGPHQWQDERTLLALEPAPAGGQQLVRYDLGSGERAVALSLGTALEADDFDHRRASSTARAGNTLALLFTNTKKVWRQNTRGDYWLVKSASSEWDALLEAGAGRRKLGGDAPEASLMFAKISPDGTRVGYVRENDLYVEDTESGAITRLTHDGSSTSINGTSDWVYEEEFDLRDAWRWSPDGQSIAFWHFDSSGVPLYTLVNTTDSLYPTLKTIPYPKAGQPNSAVRIGVIPVAGGETRWIELPGDPREHYVPRMEWSGPGELMLQQMDRRQQHNTVWLADAATGKVRELLSESTTAWLDVVDDWQWLPDGSLLWISERDGWRHAWSVSRAGEWRCLTSGLYDLTAIAGIDEQNGWLYLVASPADATRRYLYRVPLAGVGLERVTPRDQPGTHTYDLAPGAGFALHTVSGIDHPPRVELVRLPGHEPIRTLEANPALEARMAELVPVATEFFQLAIEPGVELDGWMMKPPGFDPRRSYPLLVYVYNEPSAVQVTDAWKGVRGLFHHALAEAGIVVACVDTPGTPAPRGVAWRKSTYQRFGLVGADQQAAAIRALCRERSYLDPEHVAVWGWSGGGTMTLHLMFRHAELFRLGLSVAPVPDIALYDSIYQERYTGLPASDAEAYRLNSPITYAEGLRGELLLVHGSGDDNVHMQGTERLVNRLVELGKSFDFMLYPNRTHSLDEGTGTLYHVYALLARKLVAGLEP